MDHFTGTQPVSASHAFDVTALQNYLEQSLPGFQGPLSVAQFKGGQSNPTYQLHAASGCYVMRSKPGPAARLLPSAHAIEREFTVMSWLQESGVPVPRMHLLCNDESVIGRAFFVMAFVEGRVLWDPALPGMTAGDRGAHYDEMNRVIAALHATPVEGAIAAFGRHGNYFLRQIGRWSRQYLASATESIDAMDRLIAWLPAHLPLSALDDNENAVVHGDFRLDNLIFHACEPRVVAVLDWELSTIGHPLADISYHCMAWHIPPGVFRGLGGLDLKALGVPEERDYLRRYCERTGRSDRVDALMNDWNFYLAYNLFRLASITQGIARRVLDGTASSAQARASGAATRALAALAWAFAQGAAAAH